MAAWGQMSAAKSLKVCSSLLPYDQPLCNAQCEQRMRLCIKAKGATSINHFWKHSIIMIWSPGGKARWHGEYALSCWRDWSTMFTLHCRSHRCPPKATTANFRCEQINLYLKGKEMFVTSWLVVFLHCGWSTPFFSLNVVLVWCACEFACVNVCCLFRSTYGFRVVMQREACVWLCFFLSCCEVHCVHWHCVFTFCNCSTPH